MRRAILFVVLLAILLGLILLLSSLKVRDEPAPTAAPATAAPTAGPTRPPEETQETQSPTPTAIPTAAPTPTEAPATPPPAPTEEPGEPTELAVCLEDGTKQIPAYLREYPLSEEPELRFRIVTPVNARYDGGAWSFPLESQGGGAGSETAWLELRRVSGTTAAELLPDFMSGYLRFTEIEFSGASALGSLKMNETVTAVGEGLLMKAWLLDVPQGVFAAVLCCSLDRLEPDLRYLEAMLETLTITGKT